MNCGDRVGTDRWDQSSAKAIALQGAHAVKQDSRHRMPSILSAAVVRQDLEEKETGTSLGLPFRADIEVRQQTLAACDAAAGTTTFTPRNYSGGSLDSLLRVDICRGLRPSIASAMVSPVSQRRFRSKLVLRAVTNSSLVASLRTISRLSSGSVATGCAIRDETAKTLVAQLPRFGRSHRRGQ